MTARKDGIGILKIKEIPKGPEIDDGPRRDDDIGEVGTLKPINWKERKPSPLAYLIHYAMKVSIVGGLLCYGVSFIPTPWTRATGIILGTFFAAVNPGIMQFIKRKINGLSKDKQDSIIILIDDTMGLFKRWVKFLKTK